MTQDELLQRLDEPAHRYAELDRYYTGRQPLAFLSPEAKTALRKGSAVWPPISRGWP